jgi:hypothetical protein
VAGAAFEAVDAAATGDTTIAAHPLSNPLSSADATIAALPVSMSSQHSALCRLAPMPGMRLAPTCPAGLLLGPRPGRPPLPPLSPSELPGGLRAGPPAPE